MMRGRGFFDNQPPISSRISFLIISPSLSQLSCTVRPGKTNTTSLHHPLGRMRTCLSNKKEQCDNYSSFSTKHSSVRLLGGYTAELRGSEFLARALTRQQGSRTSLYSAAVQRYQLGQVLACESLNSHITFHCTLWTCQNIDLINFITLIKCYIFISAGPGQKSISKTQ